MRFNRSLIVSILLTVTKALFGAAVVSSVETTAIPPPLGPLPIPPEESTPAIEILQTYSLPNPDEVAVDPTETFFISGTKDGYVYKTDLESGEVELIFTPKDFRPDDFHNQTLDEIRDFCDGSDISKENTCGRVLGIEFELSPVDGSCKRIWIVNAYFGIYEGSCEFPWTLEERVTGKGAFYNHVEPNGNHVYFTVSHDSKTRNQLPYVVLDDTMPRGSLYRFDTNTFETELLLDSLYFANGLISSSDGKGIYVSETTAARISKYDIATGVLEPFLENLDVYTDNIIVTKTGDLLVPGYTRNADLDSLLLDPKALEVFLQQSPAEIGQQFQAMVVPQGNLLIFDEATGSLKERVFVKNATEGFILTSSAHQLNNGDYLVGSLFVPMATRFRILPSKEPNVAASAAPLVAPRMLFLSRLASWICFGILSLPMSYLLV